MLSPTCVDYYGLLSLSKDIPLVSVFCIYCLVITIFLVIAVLISVFCTYYMRLSHGGLLSCPSQLEGYGISGSQLMHKGVMFYYFTSMTTINEYLGFFSKLFVMVHQQADKWIL